MRVAAVRHYSVALPGAVDPHPLVYLDLVLILLALSIPPKPRCSSSLFSSPVVIPSWRARFIAFAPPRFSGRRFHGAVSVCSIGSSAKFHFAALYSKIQFASGMALPLQLDSRFRFIWGPTIWLCLSRVPCPNWNFAHLVLNHVILTKLHRALGLDTDLSQVLRLVRRGKMLGFRATWPPFIQGL